MLPPLAAAVEPRAGAGSAGFRLVDVTEAAGIRFRHNNGAFGKKYLPETMGPGCAFLDYDNDGWQDILIVNGTGWPGQPGSPATLALYRNNRNGTFRDVTREAGFAQPMYGLGVAVGDYDNDGYPDIYISCLGQSRLFHNTGRGTFVDVTRKSGMWGHESFSCSAMWVDYDRDGLLDLLVTNYVRWSPDQDIFCSLDGRQKAYCTPEAYRGTTSWLFRNLGNGRFEDVTAKAGLFDSSSKSLGVAMLDVNRDGWPDLFIANDTQPNKLYRNERNGTFREIAVEAGVAFSEDGKARAGMGVDVGDLDNSGIPTLAVTNFHNEMLALFRGSGRGGFVDLAPRMEIGRLTRRSLGFGCFFFDADLDGRLDLLVVNGHIDNTVPNVEYAQAPHLFLNTGGGKFREAAEGAGREFATPKVGRGAAFGDFDNDGDLDVLITTNAGPAYLYRNDQLRGNRSARLRLVGTKSNRDAIGATVRAFIGSEMSSRTVKSGGSYLSQSELPVTFGLGRRDTIDRVVVYWPSGRTEEFRNVKAGRHEIVEGKGITVAG
ncbi:MAG TPA: CRTAC1 family protein [Bryobacteraceae bacterium]|nr:CRTAC1 family protein [Bryobacteraceae bacterium]